MNLLNKLKEYLDLDRDKLDANEAMAAITSGVQFRGSSLWILVCAIFIASLGLNMNSTAVIIGAMLISPLMGPIMGIGLGMGIGDTELVRRCVKNLLVATLFSLLASSLYFFISPINDARSELLARTQPTIYDVMIAFFGGFAGIIATGTKSKGNILPGVAIATALMPPLCTAGYGIATLQWQFFSGALYLFIINAVYIGLATWLGTYALHLPHVSAEKAKTSKYGWFWAAAILVLVVVPSFITTVGIVRRNVRETHVSQYVHQEFEKLADTHMISYSFSDRDSVRFIQVNLLGAQLSDHAIDILAARMGTYGLDETYRLQVVQGGVEAPEVDAAALSSTIMQGVVEYYQQAIQKLQSDNDSLRAVIKEMKADTIINQ